MRKVISVGTLCAIAVVIVVLLVLLKLPWPSKATSPNFVFVTIDTLRADHVGSYGYPREASPFIDYLAENGVLFEKAFSASSHTAPSHASMFTALYPFEHKMLRNHEEMDSNLFNIYKFFGESGYNVVGLPAVNFLEDKAGFPLIEFEETEEEKQQMKRHRYRSADKMVDRALMWLGRQKQSKPIFLWLHFYDVHQWQGTGQLPPQYLERVKELREDDYLDFMVKNHNTPLEFFGGPEETLEAMDGYDARLLFVNDQLERLYNSMSDLGFQKNTYWIVLSDHGEGLGNHNYGGHGEFLYNEQLHIPLIFHHTAGNLEKRRVGSLARTVDLLPTLADLVGESLVDRGLKLQGVSLLALLHGRSQDDLNSATIRFSYAERRPKDNRSHRKFWKDEEVFSLNDLDNKLILHSVENDEFFNLASDPFETNNISGTGRSEENVFSESLQDLISGRDLEASRIDNEPDITPDEVKELTTLGYM